MDLTRPVKVSAMAASAMAKQAAATTSTISNVASNAPATLSTMADRAPATLSSLANKAATPSSAVSSITSKASNTVAQLTPTKIASTPANVTDSPGNWKHPRLAEITKRQRRTEFSQRNLNSIAYNAGALIASIVVRQISTSKLPSSWFSAQTLTYASWTYLTLQLIPVINILLALLPLFRQIDDLSDIPLTPAQRKLLGLPPSSAPPTPSSTIATPPRYKRTPSQAGSASSHKSYNSSPLSGNGSPSERRMSGSPVPGSGSPLFQRAVTSGLTMNGRRSSMGSPSPLGVS
ncbi:hypothetical protein DL546_000033, partial [Coniochaeta pulveracea]